MTVGDGEGEKKQCDISETDEARRHGEDERTNEKTNRGASRGAWRQGFFFVIGLQTTGSLSCGVYCC